MNTLVCQYIIAGDIFLSNVHDVIKEHQIRCFLWTVKNLSLQREECVFNDAFKVALSAKNRSKFCPNEACL